MTDFTIQRLSRSAQHDAALEQLLYDSYVPPGYTDAARASALFRADAVHGRGQTFAAIADSGAVLGSITLVNGGSPASRLASAGEVEVHLLAVRPDARGRGVGEALGEALLREAEALRASAAWLWTQPAMQAAQRLYQRLGFERMPDRDFQVEGRAFLVYRRPIAVAARVPQSTRP